MQSKAATTSVLDMPASANPWEERYRSGDMHWDKGAPAPGLVEFLRDHPELPHGMVAVPGCGLGHDVRAWSAHGFAATGFDIAPSAVQRAFEHPQPAPVAPGRDQVAPANRPATTTGNPVFKLANFLRDAPPFRFDYLFEHTLFCAIQPEERNAYVDALLRWLKPGGAYVAIHYIVCQGGPPFPVSRAELWQRFCPHFHLIDQWVPRSYPNRTGRELMSWWRRR